jgi:aldose 1-epimerase
MLELASSALSAHVRPDVGACLEAVEVVLPDGRRQPLLLAPSREAADAGDALQSAHFAMLPYVNRVRGNVLGVEGRQIPMPPNTSEPLALHGAGWQARWNVLSGDDSHCRMGMEAPPDYPFRFRASQAIHLAGASLRIELGVTNASEQAIPAGLGFHPYFPRDPDTRLRFRAAWFWLEGPGHLPTSAIRVPPELSFGEGAALPETWRANCYSGWDGLAVIDQPRLGYSVKMTGSDALRDLMFYTPPGEAFFALEPQSHTTGIVQTDADSEAANPMRVLRPNESMTVWMELAVTTFAARGTPR